MSTKAATIQGVCTCLPRKTSPWTVLSTNWEYNPTGHALFGLHPSHRIVANPLNLFFWFFSRRNFSSYPAHKPSSPPATQSLLILHGCVVHSLPVDHLGELIFVPSIWKASYLVLVSGRLLRFASTVGIRVGALIEEIDRSACIYVRER